MSESKVEAGQRVARPALAPFRGPVRGAPVGLRPPPTPNGRVTLPPFGAVRGEVAPAPLAPPLPAQPAEPDSWYEDAMEDIAEDPVPQAMAEPSREAFQAAVKDLPLYVPDNVDVSRLTPTRNLAIPASAPSEWAAFVSTEPTVAMPTPVRARTPVLPMDAIVAEELAAAEQAAAEQAAVDRETAEEPAPPDVEDAAPVPHRMTPMRVTPILPYRPTPVMGTRTPIRPPAPSEEVAAVTMVPSASNRAVAAALEAVAAQVRRGELVVEGTIPMGDDNHSLAAALAATLGALLGVGR